MFKPIDKKRILKVCGLREIENIQAVQNLKVDFLGLIFYEKSARFVPSEKAQQLKQLSEEKAIRFVGVFVNEEIENIIEKIAQFGLYAIQLHGNETTAYLQSLKSKLILQKLSHIKVFKAFGISQNTDFQEIIAFDGQVDLFIFDTKTPMHGGSGLQFDWGILDNYFGKTPFLLSGGIGAEDATRLLTYRHDAFCGVDLNSRFEISPALKNTSLLEHFIKNINDGYYF